MYEISVESSFVATHSLRFGAGAQEGRHKHEWRVVAQIRAEELDDDAVVPLLLGHVVRFGRDRKHPDSLAEEAADVLRAILSEDRPLTNIVDKIIEDL